MRRTAARTAPPSPDHQKSGPKTQDFFGLRTQSPRMEDVFSRIRRAARSQAAVLFRGETGTGKELAAHALHALSPRSRGPFLAVNCATFTSELLASELFGHVRGAFTGAVRDRPGLFALADGGTLFLDEVAEIPRDIQARLLRVLQDQVFVPVGGTDPVRANVRIVSATHRSLRGEVEEGRFRADLMFRLRVIPIFLPSLTERPGDVALLVDHFLAELARREGRPTLRVGDSAMSLLLRYPWPGNVRELRNVLEYAVVMAEGPEIGPEDLWPEFRDEGPPGDRPVVEQGERSRILAALQESRGRKGLAAEALGWDRSTLWRKMRVHRIEG